MNMPPQVTIIMATYNRAHLIVETLHSIKAQTFTDWECLIVDDGGKDNTEEVITPILRKDSRFRLLRRLENFKKGLSGARNYGIESAKGRYIVFFDDDDIVHPENLQTCLKILDSSGHSFCRYEKKPFTGVWKSEVLEKQPIFHSGVIDLTKLEKVVMGKIPFASCCVLWKQECFSDNRFNEDLLYAEEWECYTRILSAGYSGVSINKILYFNRKHPKSNTGEFFAKNPVRKKSKIKATLLIIQNLASKKKLSPKLEKFFLQTGFKLGSKSIIEETLVSTNSAPLKKFKYRMGFIIYPFLRPIFVFKGKFKVL